MVIHYSSSHSGSLLSLSSSSPPHRHHQNKLSLKGMASSVSYASSSSYCGSSSSPSSYTNLSDEFDSDVVVIKPPPPPVPRPSRRKTPVALANASAATAAAVSAAAAVAAASTAKRNKNAQTEEGQASKKRGKQQSHQEVQPKDEARKARNRASAERSRQRRLMYTASLEGKLASAEEKSRILENRNILLEEMIRAIASGQMKAEDALTKMQSMTPIPAKPINNDDDMFAGGAAAVTAEPLPLDLDIFDSKMDVGENEVEGKAVKATKSTKPSCNGNNDNTLAQVISGSERSKLFLFYISWLSETLMLIVFQMLLIIMKVMTPEVTLSIPTQSSKTILHHLMKKNLSIGTLNLKVKQQTTDKVKEPVMNIESWIYPGRILCNHRIK